MNTYYKIAVIKTIFGTDIEKYTTEQNREYRQTHKIHEDTFVLVW